MVSRTNALTHWIDVFNIEGVLLHWLQYCLSNFSNSSNASITQLAIFLTKVPSARIARMVNCCKLSLLSLRNKFANWNKQQSERLIVAQQWRLQHSVSVTPATQCNSDACNTAQQLFRLCSTGLRPFAIVKDYAFTGPYIFNIVILIKPISCLKNIIIKMIVDLWQIFNRLLPHLERESLKTFGLLQWTILKLKC